MKNSITNKYILLLEKFLNKQATEEEIRILANWMMGTDTPKEFDLYCKQLWDTPKLKVEPETEVEVEMWNVIASKLSSHRKRFKIHPVFYRVAVAILLPLCLFMGIYMYSIYDIDKPKSFEVLVERGQKATVVLPDGSKVWLNSATSLTYNYEQEVRKVDLEGEAYFQVAKDPDKKFIVHCNDMQVEALGTIFNVKGYNNDGFVRVSLLEGSVKVYNETNSSILKPNESLAFDKKDKTFLLSEVKDSREIDFWRRNMLYFRSATLEDIAKTIERMYGVTVLFDDEEIKSIPFSGSIQNSSLSNVFHIISLTYPISYQINNDIVTIKKNRVEKKQ